MTESISGIRTILSADSLQAKSEKNITIKSAQDNITAVATVRATFTRNNNK